MNKSEIAALKTGDKILHKHFGKCVLQQYFEGMGLVVKPLTKEGKILLQCYSRTPLGTPVLDSFRMFRPLNRPFAKESEHLKMIRSRLVGKKNKSIEGAL